MSYEIEIIRKEQFQVSKWSGGTTTQLAIFPKNAIYSERNFKWRLSSAKVEVEESVFTPLPNINRIIMIIEGKLILEHVGHHRSILESFDQDYFCGNWKTKSFGKVTDFNLMMSEDCQGELEAIHVEKEQLIDVVFINNSDFKHNFNALYCVNGRVNIEFSTNEIVSLYKGDIILVIHKDDIYLKVYNIGESKVDLIRAVICY